MKTSNIVRWVLLFTAGIAPVAGAGFSQSTITSPGGFMQAGSYATTSGGGIIPGADISASFGLGMDFQEQAFTGAGSAAASATGTSDDIHNSADGETGMGFARFTAHNSCPNWAGFALGTANGGWKETFTVNHPTLTGQPGFMVFELRYRGHLEATGFAGSTSIVTTGYKNGTELMTNPLFDRGGSDPISTDRQRVRWGLSSGTTVTRTIDGVVTMAVPITFGQSFTLGVYATALCGQRSSSGVPGLSTATLNFGGSGVTWNGITSVQSGGVPISGYTIISGTGMDWTQPFVTCEVDLSGDGIVDFGDYLEFLNLFEAQDLAVDFNGDGIVDFSDYLEFLNLFEAGC